jgi:hypothetical protein
MLQQAAEYVLIHSIILHHQHPSTAKLLHKDLSRRRLGASSLRGGEDLWLADGYVSQPHREPERAANSRRADHPGVSSHQLGQSLGNGESQAAAAVFASARAIHLGEGMEEFDLLFGSQANAVIADLDAQLNAAQILLEDRPCG